MPLFAIFIIVFGYAFERIAEIADFEKTKAFVLAVGGVMCVLFVLSALLIYKSKKHFFCAFGVRFGA